MKHLFSVLVFAILSCLSLEEARAGHQGLAFGKLFFGSEEKIADIQDIKGTVYKLGHKYTLHFFIAGIYLSDDGYVLLKKTEFKAYRPLTDLEIKDLQGAGMLPTPLPKYSIPLWEYLFGYSLWIVVAFAVGAPVLQYFGRRLMGKDFAHPA